MTRPTTTVLLREASRTARRWQTYAVRTLFSGALMVLVVAGIFVATEAPGVFSSVDAADLGWVGRGLFIGFAVVQTLLGFVFAPLLVARAIVEEREDRTIELLMLTRLTAGQVLAGKFASRIAMLLTVVLGALPIMTLVVSLGGVGIVEVVAVTLHTVVAVVVLGALGAFFALFTRSPLVATGMALFYALPAFLGVPLVYGLLVADPAAFSHLSPLFGATGRGLGVVLPVFAYAPVVWLVFRLGAPLFALRVTNARLGRLFHGSLWRLPGLLPVLLAFGFLTIVGLPVGIVGAWWFRFTSATGASQAALELGAVGLVWAWFVVLLYLGTWLYLRLGMDMVIVFDGHLEGDGRSRRRSSKGLWSNPVLWREARPRSWRAILPSVFAWACLLVLVFQTGIWIVPGGLLTLGAANAVGALLLGMWTATASIERERHDGTLSVLLTTTLPAWRIVLGKLAGSALPSGLVLFVSFPMILLGLPYLELLLDVSFLETVARAVGFCGWLVAAWALSMVVAMAVALRVRRSRAAYGVNLALGVVFVVVPALAAALFPGAALIRVPARLLVPVLSARAAWWEILGSTLGMGALALVVFVGMVLRLREWGRTDG